VSAVLGTATPSGGTGVIEKPYKEQVFYLETIKGYIGPVTRRLYPDGSFIQSGGEEYLESLPFRLHIELLQASLNTAGQFVSYYEDMRTQGNNGTIVLNVHTSGADKTQQVAEQAWDNLSEDIKATLKELDIGFAVRQI